MSIFVTFKQTNTQRKKEKQRNKINKGKNQQNRTKRQKEVKLQETKHSIK